MALIALGANLGDPVANLQEAVRQLSSVGEVTGRSALYRTEPVGGPPDQPPYVNAVVRLRTAEPHPDPRTLMQLLLDVERRLGRERKGRWGPRLIDLDLLDYGGRIFIGPATGEDEGSLPPLRLPHPRMAERAFVLAPLADLAPDWRHPTLRRSAAELLERTGTEGVERLPEAW